MPQTSTYLTVITHVAVQLVDIMRTLQKKKEREREKYIMFLILCLILQFFSQCYSRLYLAGVSGAGLWDITVVYSVSTYHASPLILDHRMKMYQVNTG